ncbi:MAG: helix-turn-helix domain-containing protein [Acidobacteria bacterium]|nr:helix-turn-helix domain-containing protein [Acidobacteriota bacterium]
MAARVDRDDAAERITSAIRAQIEPYRRLPEDVVRGEVRLNVRTNVDLVLAMLEGREIGTEDLEPFRAAARERADEGVPLDDVLHAYRLGAQVGWEILAGAATPEEARVMLQSASLVLDWAERVSADVARTYLAERRDVLSEWETQARRLLGALAAGGSIDAGEIRAAGVVGFTPADLYRPFAVGAPGGAAIHRRIAEELRARGMLAVPEADRTVGVAAAGFAGSWPGDCGGQIVVIGDPTAPAGLGEALEEVRRTCDLARRLGRLGEVTPRMFIPELLLAGSPRLSRMAGRVLDPLTHNRRGYADLLQTLQAFIACGLDRRLAAARLHVHPNTLGYRLRRAEQITGLRLDSAEDLCVLTLALKTRQLGAEEGSSGAQGPGAPCAIHNQILPSDD